MVAARLLDGRPVIDNVPPFLLAVYVDRPVDFDKPVRFAIGSVLLFFSGHSRFCLAVECFFSVPWIRCVLS